MKGTTPNGTEVPIANIQWFIVNHTHGIYLRQLTYVAVGGQEYPQDRYHVAGATAQPVEFDSYTVARACWVGCVVNRLYDVSTEHLGVISPLDVKRDAR